MVQKTIADMTVEELKTMIDRRVSDYVAGRPERNRTQAEVHDSIRRNRWTPPAGAKSPREMLREDRDR